MPYKDPQKRREAYSRWRSKNKDRHAAYQRILYAAKKANKNPEKCSVNGCDSLGERHHPDYTKPAEIIWICRFHHRRTHHAGSCSICGDKVSARGFCNKHYKSERRKIDPEYVEAVRRSVRKSRGL